MADVSQYLVSHLVTFSLQEDEVRDVEEALSRLSHLAHTDRLWSQQMLVEVSWDAVRLRDAQNQDELEVYPVSSIHRCDAILTEKQFPSLLLLVCQSGAQKKPDILFFSCENERAELIREDIVGTVSYYTSKTSKRPEFLSTIRTQDRQTMMALPGIRNPSVPHASNPALAHPPPYPGSKVNGSRVNNPDISLQQAEREVEILNHCFSDIELFMGRLQKSAETQTQTHTVLNQKSKKKKKKKSRKKGGEADDLIALRAQPPKDDDFVSIFQKFKYCFCLLDRLKSFITNPSSEELLHHLFRPLDVLVRTTGGPASAAAVSSPAMTNGAITLLQDNLTAEEKQLWTSLGPNWMLPRSLLPGSGSTMEYMPIFQDGWKPELLNPHRQLWEDPVQAQHKLEALKDKKEVVSRLSVMSRSPVRAADEMDSKAPPAGGDQLYRCTYDFVARNSSELSVLQGETLEVVESSKRWWKCRNRFDQVGFVPFNILEPLSGPSEAHAPSPGAPQQSKIDGNSMSRPFSYSTPSLLPLNPDPPALRPSSMPPDATHTLPGDNTDRVIMMNDELLQRLANGKSNTSRSLVIPRSFDTAAPLNYSSPPAEVEEWLRGKGFSEATVRCLGILTGAQLFSLNKEELRSVVSDEGARVYSQIMVQKALLEDVHKATELETVMEKQKMKVDLKQESTTF
ncbi:epidermal growth factor receptor kinase substrate 8-like protein 1 isoform X3 [Scleropages formosus]|uniref:epidermal growth factor receptor kinase substrate 8-like protein 1 isoform X3 n=1 Tax=Scleropages formosus TaxID=113540 RepID=UPI000878D69E|nr:epidermal growth factor receptor kinase substrate 8-like protein 1 isoform X3 [Scleropages formosus]